jgi:hypothetical protein
VGVPTVRARNSLIVLEGTGFGYSNPRTVRLFH